MLKRTWPQTTENRTSSDGHNTKNRRWDKALYWQGTSLTLVCKYTRGEGLALVQSEKPDLILLDIMLPGGLNGFDVLEQLKRNPKTQKIPVVVLTNLDSEEEVAKKIGASDYKVKANTEKDEIVKLVVDYLKSPKAKS